MPNETDYRCKGSLNIGTGCLRCSVCQEGLISFYKEHRDSAPHFPNEVTTWAAAELLHQEAIRDYDLRTAAILARVQKFPDEIGTEIAYAEKTVVLETKEAVDKLLAPMHQALLRGMKKT